MFDIEDPLMNAAFWSCVQEPGEGAAHHIRTCLGGVGATRWLIASGFHHPGIPVHIPKGSKTAQSWEQTWTTWKQRARAADPEEELRRVANVGGRLIHPGSDEWPSRLDDLGELEEPHHTPPPALWVIGDLPPERSVALVGARACTHYGQNIAASLAMELAEAGVPVVSGGAYGVDIAAHRAALGGGGRTHALLAGGLCNLYPDAHMGTFREMADRGGLITESPPTWRAARWRFIRRNRLIAALTRGTVVVEAAVRSGALATIRRARDMGRRVGAVPGPLTSKASTGANGQIRDGASLIRNGADVLEMIDPIGTHDVPLFEFGEDTPADLMPPNRRRVWDALPVRGGTSVAKAALVCGLSEPEVAGALEILRMDGFVVPHAKGWARSNKCLE